MKTTQDSSSAQHARVGVEASAHVERLAGIFKMLADPTRLRILAALAEHGSLCVHELTTWLGMQQSAVSHQLRLLRSARLVRGQRDGREIHYRLDDAHVLALLSQGLRHVRHERGGAR